MKEIWKPIIVDGHLTKYEASSRGRIRHSETKHVKSQQPCGKGYRMVTLVLPHTGKQRSLQVGRLVAEAFMGPRSNGEQIEHLDQNKTNNRLKNLAYVTQSTNIIRSYMLSDRKSGGHNRYLHPDSHELIKDLWASGKYSQVEIGKIVGVDNSTVSKIVNGKMHARPNGKEVLVADFSVVGGER